MKVEKPYTYLPHYADVEYVDGKLRVARASLAAVTTDEARRGWRETIDILLDQRAALAAIEGDDLHG